MKKTILSVLLLALVGTTTFAQESNKRKSLKASSATTTENSADVMKFKAEVYDFGNVKEGDKAEHVFEFVNKSKKPITIQNVQTTCGCTSPTWTKEPIAPGKKGKVTVAYSTPGRVGPIDRQVTVLTDVGSKALKIKGMVVAKPTASVPQNNSAIKAH